jgi:glycerol-3-phosphate acyltransferase PlsY
MNIENLIPLISYLLGSVPFGYILVRAAEGADIRKTGSGNIGATNVYRKSRWAGITTLLLDAGKGYLAVLIAAWISGGDGAWTGIAALCAVVGHVFTVWLRFRGGKGVATGCGAFLAITPLSVATTLVVFIVILVFTRYISAASIAATALFPLCALLYGCPSAVIAWAAPGCLLIIVKHHQNIRRIFSRTENKFSLSGVPERKQRD